MHYKYYYSREQLLANAENANQRYMVTIACEALLMIMVMSALCKHTIRRKHACINANTHINIEMHANTHRRAHTHTHTNTRMHRKTRACELKHIHTHIQTHTQT